MLKNEISILNIVKIVKKEKKLNCILKTGNNYDKNLTWEINIILGFFFFFLI